MSNDNKIPKDGQKRWLLLASKRGGSTPLCADKAMDAFRKADGCALTQDEIDSVILAFNDEVAKFRESVAERMVSKERRVAYLAKTVIAVWNRQTDNITTNDEECFCCASLVPIIHVGLAK